MLPSVCFLDSDQLGRSKAAEDAPLRLHGAGLAARPPDPRRAWLAGAVQPRARLVGLYRVALQPRIGRAATSRLRSGSPWVWPHRKATCSLRNSLLHALHRALYGCTGAALGGVGRRLFGRPDRAGAGAGET